MADGLRVLHVIDSLAPEFGGPAHSLPPLALAHAACGPQVRLIHRIAGAAGKTTADGITGLDVLRLHDRDRLRKEVERADLVHVHGLWERLVRWTVAEAARAGIPYVLRPFGTLRPDALRRKGLKKRLALRLLYRGILERAAALHATSLQEAREMRALGLRVPIAVVPTGVALDALSAAAGAFDPATRWPELAGRRRLLFLGRVHPIKGLANLVQAWGSVASENADWHLVVAGPDEDGHRRELEAMVVAAGLSGRTTFTGAVGGAEKVALLRSSDAFVLPSFTENFGLSACEALACGLPVIVSTGTPWEGVEREGCGYRVAPEPTALAGAIRKVARLTDSARAAMGERGRAWVERSFTVEAAARSLVALHDWVRGGPRPAFVHLAPEPR